MSTFDANDFNLPAYIQVPYFVYMARNLTENEKLLFSHLYSFYTSGKPIRASNAYYSVILGVQPRTVQSILEGLETKGWIKRFIEPMAKNNSKRTIKIIRKGEGPILYDDDENSPPKTLEAGSRSKDHPGHDPKITPVTIQRSPNNKVDTKVDTTTAAPRLAENVSSSIFCKNVSNEHQAKLSKLGFCNADINELYELYSHNLNLLHQSIDYLVFDVEVNNRANLIDIKIEYWFMKIMRKLRGFNMPAGYAKPTSTKNTPNVDRNKQIFIKYFHEKLADWFYRLTNNQKNQLGFHFLNDNGVEQYFGLNIWPKIFEELKRA